MLLVSILLVSCGPACHVGQDDADRINRNEQQFNNDMQNSLR